MFFIESQLNWYFEPEIHLMLLSPKRNFSNRGNFYYFTYHPVKEIFVIRIWWSLVIWNSKRSVNIQKSDRIFYYMMCQEIFEMVFWVLSLKEVAWKCTKESLLTVFVPYVMRTKASDQWRASQGVTNVVFEQRMGSNWDSNLFQCQKVLMLQRMVLPYPLPSSRLSAGGPPTFIGESPSVFWSHHLLFCRWEAFQVWVWGLRPKIRQL